MYHRKGMWCLRHPPHRQDSAVLRPATRCQDTRPVLRGMGQEQVGIVESSAMQDCALAHIITRMFAFVPAVYSPFERSFVPFRIAATFS